MATPTMREQRILNQAEEIKIKLQWLDANPGKTRGGYWADYYRTLLETRRQQRLQQLETRRQQRLQQPRKSYSYRYRDAAKAISEFFARNNKGYFSEQEIKDAVPSWALPRREKTAVAVVHDILTEKYFQDPSSGKFSMTPPPVPVGNHADHDAVHEQQVDH